MKRIFVLVLALGFIFAISSVGAQSTLVYGTTDKMSDIDPANAYDFHTWEIFYNTMDPLVGYVPGTSTLTPALATSWKSNAKGDEFTFTLRKNVKFSDGTPLTADVVKWTIDRNAALGGDPSWLITDFVKEVAGRGSHHGEVHPQESRCVLPPDRGEPALLSPEPERVAQGQVGP